VALEPVPLDAARRPVFACARHASKGIAA
jgi:hypothetical protein